jgi:hypothetical protein
VAVLSGRVIAAHPRPALCAASITQCRVINIEVRLDVLLGSSFTFGSDAV